MCSSPSRAAVARATSSHSSPGVAAGRGRLAGSSGLVPAARFSIRSYTAGLSLKCGSLAAGPYISSVNYYYIDACC